MAAPRAALPPSPFVIQPGAADLVKHGRTPYRRTPVPGKTPGAAHRVFLTLQNTGGFCLDICIMQWFGPARPPVRNLPTGHCSSLLFLPDAKIFRHEGRSRSPVHGRLQTLVDLVGRSLPLPYARPSLVSRDLDRATCPMSGRQDGGRPSLQASPEPTACQLAQAFGWATTRLWMPRPACPLARARA